MAASDTASGAAPAVRVRRSRLVGPGRRTLAVAAVLAMVGALLPWVRTRVGDFSGLAGPGVWTFYAASLGLAGALVRSRGLALAQAAVFALVALGLPAWQTVRLLDRGLALGGDGWVPGVGLVLTVCGGLLALRAALTMRT